ncbi:hypothetical protein MIMGU_mgv1a006931mg [Erythranthe guttata]|uniref:Uncharacterized protein n=1 Tax=Erythranthe guttata TaxID=4155 RepID=A0A022QA85_ERYGU|nr:hypothetical protein MIMGU_mgv1a006931mg [Erythranthe guttata]
MAATATTLLETCQIQPPISDDELSLSVPLSFFDIAWLHFHPIRRLLFYNHPCSKPYFLETLVPNLKESLSLTLKHYLPASGNLLYPKTATTEKKPVFRYVTGDSVSLTIAESNNDDFDELITNHARDADRFYNFVPEFPPEKDELEYKIVPLIALQITLFPNRGICIGFANHHCVGDASSIVGSFVKDPLQIDRIFWKVLKDAPLKSSSFQLPTNRVRATYVLHPADIQKLKDLVLTKKPGLVRVSSFVVTVSYVWTCLAKSLEEIEDDALEFFIFAVDVRARINPPVPANYFGNCLSYGRAIIEHKTLVGELGFFVAAEAMALDIKNRVNNKDEVLKGAENWMSDRKKFSGAVRAVGVSGSPKFDLCDADFGWGRARKLEVVSIDGEKYSISLCKSNGSEGGLEIGLSLPKERMEAFATIFADGL